MRIVQVSDCYLPRMGGIEAQVSRLSEQLAARGHEVLVLTATSEDGDKGIASPRESAYARDAWLREALDRIGAGSGVGRHDEAHAASPQASSGVEPSQSASAAAESSDGNRLAAARSGSGSLPAPAVDQTQTSPPQHAQVLRSVWRNPLDLPIDPRAGKRFAELIRELNPDVVNFHMGELTPVVMDALARLRGTNTPTVVTIHSVWSNGVTVAGYRAGARALSLDREPIIWSPVSELVARNVRRVVEPGHVEIQGNGVDQRQWRGEPLPHQGLRAVAATRFAPRKRVPELLDVLKRVGDALGINAPATADRPSAMANDNTTPSADPDVPNGILEVVLAGEGPELDRARRFLAEHGMDGWVKTPGRLTQKELQSLYRESDVFLAPGVKDSFSIAGREGLVAGLAILTRSQSGLGSDLDDGVEGRSVASDQQMAATLIQWAREPSLVTAMKEHNLATDYRYSWDHVIPQTLRMYEDAARLVHR